MPKWIDRRSSGCLLVDIELCCYFLLELGWSEFFVFQCPISFLRRGLFVCVKGGVLLFRVL
jgi:hypothetical protein